MNIRKFQIRQSDFNGQWHVRIIGLNGEPLFSSEQYARLAGAENVVSLIDPDGDFPVERINRKGILVEKDSADPTTSPRRT